MCGPRDRDADDAHAVTNPTLLVEVTSPSTEAYDRGDKFEHYKRLPSLREFVLVSHRSREVEVWTRDGQDRWASSVYGEGAVAPLASIGARLDVRELYEAAAEPAD